MEIFSIHLGEITELVINKNNMADYKSKKAIASKSPASLYMAFVDMRNFYQMLPEDKKEGVIADYDSISTTVQGFTIGAKIIERVPYSLIKFADNNAPFAFNITMHFDAVSTNLDKTELFLELSAELNFMMKTMLGSKIEKFLNQFVDAIVNISEGKMPEGIDPSMYPEGFKGGF